MLEISDLTELTSLHRALAAVKSAPSNEGHPLDRSILARLQQQVAKALLEAQGAEATKSHPTKNGRELDDTREPKFELDVFDGCLSLYDGTYYLMLDVAVADLLKLKDVSQASWEKRQSLQVGHCLGHSVYWCVGSGSQTQLLIGHDEEAWELLLTLPTVLVERIAAEAEGS